MTHDPSQPQSAGWDEEASQTFMDYGRYFVPEREVQSQIITALIPRYEMPGAVLDLCCGEGLLAKAILDAHPGYRVLGLDASPAMLARAGARLARHGDRFQPHAFDIFHRTWPEPELPVRAVVSSLAIHHLDGPGKQALFQEVTTHLAPGGLFIIADLVAPALDVGRQVAADAWDAAVRARAQALDGNQEAFAAFERLCWNSYRYFDPDDIDHPSRLVDQLTWLADAGLVDVDVYWMQAGHAIFAGRRPDSIV